ncbi:MAG: ORF6N domain-containing protein [Bdellovibrionales bacterium]|nr:ORF6N domain-containing protein [Bdellovibrionales bacterium]
MLLQHKVILDQDLAVLYGASTKALVQAVKRNLDRFPKDFMFQLSDKEFEILKSQFVTSKTRGGGRYTPYAFTEQGVAMLSSVPKSKQAALVNVEIIRVFVRLRAIFSSHTELAKKLVELEKKVDMQYQTVFEAIHQLMIRSEKQKRTVVHGLDIVD